MIKNLITIFGEYVRFQIAVFLHLTKIKKRLPEITIQMKRIGFDSLLLISITSGFTGLVTSVQASYQTSGYIPENLIGVLVGKSTMIELAPVLTGLVLTGKVGASIAAEIGTMKVSEQLDALKTMAIDPIDYIYMPRILAGILMFPILTIFSNFVGIFAAFLLSVGKYQVNAFSFFSNMRDFFLPSDLWGGLVKSVFFGLIITSIGCFTGSKASGGAEGVGKVATLTVVYSAICILIMDFIVASILFGGMV
ncbi:MAG: ABC transporter permease [Candidatus Cloacimonetes bacterium]|nr:ABC transporter permease [Candidatus Cloacimonadota bacterium]MCF7813952.1 ABC transporter permease [Candidatus Cloacimonadota bacterium]MCF7868046.1 ABC transporter permease [Candidatus Cloacimonadota bacterium]MCF7883966.1 ABC transporter permease [Candidatus Cloacimonadota bacterium]